MRAPSGDSELLHQAQSFRSMLSSAFIRCFRSMLSFAVFVRCFRSTLSFAFVRCSRSMIRRSMLSFAVFVRCFRVKARTPGSKPSFQWKMVGSVRSFGSTDLTQPTAESIYHLGYASNRFFRPSFSIFTHSVTGGVPVYLLNRYCPKRAKDRSSPRRIHRKFGNFVHRDESSQPKLMG
jgi:hypothetical protein